MYASTWLRWYSLYYVYFTIIIRNWKKRTNQSFTLTEDCKGFRGWEEGRGLPGPRERGTCGAAPRCVSCLLPTDRVDTQCREPRLTP